MRAAAEKAGGSSSRYRVWTQSGRRQTDGEFQKLPVRHSVTVRSRTWNAEGRAGEEAGAARLGMLMPRSPTSSVRRQVLLTTSVEAWRSLLCRHLGPQVQAHEQEPPPVRALCAWASGQLCGACWIWSEALQEAEMSLECEKTKAVATCLG